MAIAVANRKPVSSLMANSATGRKPVSSSNATISRRFKHPAKKVSSFRREFHSRGFLRFKSFVLASVLKKKAKPRDCFGNEEISGGKFDLCGLALDAKKPTLSSDEKEKKGTELREEEAPLRDSISKDSSFKQVQVAEDLVKVNSTTWGIGNGENGNNLRLSLVRRSPRWIKKHVLAKKPTSRFQKKENKIIELSDEEDPSGDSISKDSSFKRVQVAEDNLAKEDSSTWGFRNCENGNSSRESLLRRSPRLVEKHVQVSHETFLPLKEEEEAEVRSSFSGRNRMKVLASHKNSNIDICGETLQCLKPCAWLNDEVINLYLELLKERETREPQKYFKCHFFNTFFYIKLAGGSGYNYQAVRRWTTQRKLGYNLSDCDIIFVPIHGGVHWTLAVINIRECKFQYLDSLKGSDPRILKALAKYLVDEVKDKSGEDIDVSLWDMEYVKDLPQQKNGYDCGMFMLKYIDFYSRGLKLHFSQKDMPYFRLRTAKEILRLQAD